MREVNVLSAIQIISQDFIQAYPCLQTILTLFQKRGLTFELRWSTFVNLQINLF